MLNTFVHIVMYSYYLLAALGPRVQPYLWWKKYLTILQMAQFVAVMVHTFQLLFIECDYPKAFVWWIGMHALMFYFLFKNFYDSSYKKPPRKGQAVPVANGKDSQSSKKTQNGSTPQSNMYANEYKMATGYISGSGLRNRVFIDNTQMTQ